MASSVFRSANAMRIRARSSSVRGIPSMAMEAFTSCISFSVSAISLTSYIFILPTIIFCPLLKIKLKMARPSPRPLVPFCYKSHLLSNELQISARKCLHFLPGSHENETKWNLLRRSCNSLVIIFVIFCKFPIDESESRVYNTHKKKVDRGRTPLPQSSKEQGPGNLLLTKVMNIRRKRSNENSN